VCHLNSGREAVKDQPPNFSFKNSDQVGKLAQIIVGAMNRSGQMINAILAISHSHSGLFMLPSTIMFCVPLMVQSGSNIGAGLNVVVDTLLLSGAMLCLAGRCAQSEERGIMDGRFYEQET